MEKKVVSIEDLEQQVRLLKERIQENREVIDLSRLEEETKKLQRKIFSDLESWQRVQLARHTGRPYFFDYVERIVTDFYELHGDRAYGDDKAMVGGIGKLGDRPVMLIGQQKGRDIKSRTYRNFGMPHPEGYRKALRLMKLAEKFGIPVICLIDTPGAFPGIGSEERGIAGAIAENIMEMTILETPIVVVIIGEGGSGGALGIGVGDRVLMMENTYYSVISPEGCASILWRNPAKAPIAADSLKLTAKELLEFGIIDTIVPEPRGGAQESHEEAAKILADHLVEALDEIDRIPAEELTKQRIAKFTALGRFEVR